VLGRFPESIPDDLILLATFAGEREDSSQGIDSGSLRVPNQNEKKPEPFKPKFAEKAKKAKFCQFDNQKASSKVLTKIDACRINPGHLPRQVPRQRQSTTALTSARALTRALVPCLCSSI
jgi:hypothetical protein